MPKPEKKDQLKQWIVYCEICGGVFCESKPKPTQCPINPAHPIDGVKKEGAVAQGTVMASDDGTKWVLYITNQGQVRAETL